jgi:hypothetical protein
MDRGSTTTERFGERTARPAHFRNLSERVNKW